MTENVKFLIAIPCTPAAPWHGPADDKKIIGFIVAHTPNKIASFEADYSSCSTECTALDGHLPDEAGLWVLEGVIGMCSDSGHEYHGDCSPMFLELAMRRPTDVEVQRFAAGKFVFEEVSGG